MNSLAVYAVANYASFLSQFCFLKQIQRLACAGVDCVQLRDDRSELQEVLRTAEATKKILGDIPMFMNALRMDTKKALMLAQRVDVAGVYLEGKASYSETRSILGSRSCIGIPVKTMEEVLAAEELDVDYLSVKVFNSKNTCPRKEITWGIEGLREVRAISSHRIVVIGGIDENLVESIYAELKPGDGIAMAGGLMNAPDPCATVQKMRKLYQERTLCGIGMRT